MYAQYQQYQQQNVGAAAPAQQSGLSWNGRQWVPQASAAAPVGTSTFSTYQQQTNNGNIAHPGAVAAANTELVQKFTRYYHQWTAKGNERRLALSRLSSDSFQRQNAQRLVDWAKYYADQSSRAAYYFHENPTATTAPFELPPHPDDAEANKAPATGTSSYQQPAQSSLPTGPTAVGAQQQPNSSSPSPDSLKRYVDGCLRQCSTAEEKKMMTAEVQKVIQSAVKDGTLHSRDWSSVPLIPVHQEFCPSPPPKKKPRVQTAASASVYGSSQQQNFGGGGNDSYYGPSSSDLDTSKNHQTNTNDFAFAGGGQSHGVLLENSQSNNNYYGPSVLSSTTASNTHHSFQRKQHQSMPNNDKSWSATSKKKPFLSISSSSSQQNKNECSYYGPGSALPSTSTKGSFDQQETNNYYGPQAGNESSPDIFESENDFVALPGSGNKKNKKFIGQNRKNSGFDAGSAVLGTRAKRFAGKGGLSDSSSVPRAVQGIDKYMGKSCIGGKKGKLDEYDYEQMTVKGTCKILEKDYLRLTAPPRAERVRPQSVLEQHLTNLKAEWQREKGDRHDYLWFCSQLKAARQDCTVQRIQNAFAVDVYETHARIALQEDDLNEYNQCQTQLKELYLQLRDVQSATHHRNEFLAYRLIYYVFLTCNEKYDGGSSDLFKIMLSLTKEQREDPAIKHALKVRVAVADVDYHAFFRLYQHCPNLGRYLMDKIVPVLRYLALQRICKAYRPTVEVDFVLDELGFKTEKSTDLEHGRKYLISCGCVLNEDNSELLTKDTTIHESDLEEKKSLI